MADVIDINGQLQDKKDGPWLVFQDTCTDQVDVVPYGLLVRTIDGEITIQEHHHSFIRAIIEEFCHLKGID